MRSLASWLWGADTFMLRKDAIIDAWNEQEDVRMSRVMEKRAEAA